MANPFLRSHPEIQPSPISKPLPLDTCLTVDIFHPIRRVPFLVLPAFDYDSEGVSGVHFGTVLTACWALAVNREGHLVSIDDEFESQAITREQDDVLPAGKYLYVLKTSHPQKITKFALISITGNFLTMCLPFGTRYHRCRDWLAQ
jgi:hypothetical protein